MLLKDLLVDLPGVLETKGNMDARIDALITDSREKTSGGLFFCISGARFDAHTFVGQAEKNGCVAFVVEHILDADVPQVKVETSVPPWPISLRLSTAIPKGRSAWWACAAPRARPRPAT